jgi:hypothetical protein
MLPRRQAATAVGGALLLSLGLSACAAGAPDAPPATGETPDESTLGTTSDPASTPAEGPTTTPALPAEPTTPAATAPTYRDGEYLATGWYGSLPSHHDVTLTIAGDVVTAVDITTPAENETSLGYQQRFAAALPDAIIGRDIDELAVDRLAGSSGCSEGFMDALAQIKVDAAG